MENKGVIYILTNPSFPEYVKIGYADDIDKRLKQLNRSECTPFAFRVYATYEVNSRLSDLKSIALLISSIPICVLLRTMTERSVSENFMQ